MALQMIFCVETTKRADTDSVYLSETINNYYELTNQIKISKVYMETKSKYNSKSVLKEIEQKRKAYSIGETKVIYCIDTDEYESNYDHKRELGQVSQFCKENNYDLVWFCHDVEDVFLGKRISDSEKVSQAAAFRTKELKRQLQLRHFCSVCG